MIGYLLHALPEDAPHPPTAPVPPQCPARAALQSVAPAPPASARSISLPVSKATIASRLSITPEYFSRVLHDLEAAVLIHIDKRDIHIPDTARLAKYPM